MKNESHFLNKSYLYNEPCYSEIQLKLTHENDILSANHFCNERWFWKNSQHGIENFEVCFWSEIDMDTLGCEWQYDGKVFIESIIDLQTTG